MNLSKTGLGYSRPSDEVAIKRQSLWPKSERRRSSYGSTLASVQTVPGLCSERKCVRKADHSGAHWPQ